VKQGCSLSQILFGLYISSLGVSLDNTKVGVQLGEMILTALFLLMICCTEKPMDVTKRSCPSSWFRSGRNIRRRISNLT